MSESQVTVVEQDPFEAVNTAFVWLQEPGDASPPLFNDVARRRLHEAFTTDFDDNQLPSLLDVLPTSNLLVMQLYFSGLDEELIALETDEYQRIIKESLALLMPLSQPPREERDTSTEIYTLSSVGQSVIYELLDLRYDDCADEGIVTEQQLEEIIQVILSQSRLAFKSTYSQKEGRLVSPAEKLRLILLYGYAGAAQTIGTNDNNLRQWIWKLMNPDKSRILSEETSLRRARNRKPLADSALQFVFGADRVQLEWMDSALCAQTDPEAFYPEKGGPTKEAKNVCQNCEVLEQCREYALENNERFGIWGGLSERERRRLIKQRAEQAGVTSPK